MRGVLVKGIFVVFLALELVVNVSFTLTQNFKKLR